MSEPQTPRDKAALLAASPEELAGWSAHIALPEIDIDALALEAVEQEVASALLASDLTREEAAPEGFFAWLVEVWRGNWRVIWPTVPALALGLFVMVSSQTLQRDALRPKGAGAKASLYMLRSVLGQSGPGTFLQPAATLLTKQSFSVGFQLLSPGGYAAILWRRGQAPPALLFQTRRAHKSGQIAYLLRQGQIIKFPLRGEAPGRVCLQLLQLRKPLQTSRLQATLRRLSLPVQAQEAAPHQALLATATFCFVIAQTPKRVKGDVSP